MAGTHQRLAIDGDGLFLAVQVFEVARLKEMRAVEFLAARYTFSASFSSP